MNTGEELVSSYLQYILGCEFIQKNLYTVDTQGEIDVVGINLKEQRVYLCEVAIHLITGLQYTKGTAPNNVQKLTEKLNRDIQYATKFFPEYKKTRHAMESYRQERQGQLETQSGSRHRRNQIKH